MNITKRYSFATEQESICTCAAVEAWAGEYVLYSDFNKLEMHLLKTQAKLMLAYAEINKLRDPGGCDHDFELFPNGVVQCLKCGFAHV